MTYVEHITRRIEHYLAAQKEIPLDLFMEAQALHIDVARVASSYAIRQDNEERGING